MKIVFSKEFIRKLSIVSIFFASIFQFYILFTIVDIIDKGLTETNFLMLLFNISYILSFYFFNQKIDAIFEMRGKYLKNNREKISKEDIAKNNEEICKKIFEEILDGDFRP